MSETEGTDLNAMEREPPIWTPPIGQISSGWQHSRMSRKAILGLSPTAFAISSFIVILASPRPRAAKSLRRLVRANKPPEEGTGWHRHIAAHRDHAQGLGPRIHWMTH
jgi:hypothetical protein